MAAIQLASVVCRSPSQPRQGIPRATIAHNVGGGTGASGWISALLAGVSVFHGEAFTAQALTTSKAAAAAARGQIAGRPGSGSRRKTATARTHGNRAPAMSDRRNPFPLVDFGDARRSGGHGVAASHRAATTIGDVSSGDSAQNFSNYAAASAPAFSRRATPLRNIGMQAGTRKERKKQTQRRARTRIDTLTKKSARQF